MLRRSYLKMEWIEQVMNSPILIAIQPNGRVRMWGLIEEMGKYLRVVTESDGVTIHNAFFDRRFKPNREELT